MSKSIDPALYESFRALHEMSYKMMQLVTLLTQEQERAMAAYKSLLATSVLKEHDVEDIHTGKVVGFALDQASGVVYAKIEIAYTGRGQLTVGEPCVLALNGKKEGTT